MQGSRSQTPAHIPIALFILLVSGVFPAVVVQNQQVPQHDRRTYHIHRVSKSARTRLPPIRFCDKTLTPLRLTSWTGAGGLVASSARSGRGELYGGERLELSITSDFFQYRSLATSRLCFWIHYRTTLLQQLSKSSADLNLFCHLSMAQDVHE